MDSDLRLELTDSPSREDNHQVELGLDAYNTRFAEPHNHRPLSIFLRDPEGKIAAGLVGGTHWGWLHVELLWVYERLRGQGWGSRILKAAEDEARARGCRHADLDTLSFQALPFYEKQGYVIWGVLEDYPPGHKRYYVKKDLA